MQKKNDFLSGLNDSQKKAVLHNDGPLLVLAGAGSGKTRVLTLRIARLVHEKRCKPDEILAVTFTNKAAREMRERVASLTSTKTAEAMTLCTFHSLGAKILREDGHHIGLKPAFTILGDHERTATLRSLMRTSGIRGLKEEEHDALANRISLAKNGAKDPEEFKKENPDERKINRLYAAYHATLRTRQSVDFDDLLLQPLLILRKFGEVLQKYRRRFAYLSIDEFQDTSGAQMELVSLLAAPRNNVIAVGDDDQGIYSWRGAEIANILSFPSRFNDCPMVVLNKNYRSTPKILGGAMAVIEHNRRRTPKNVTAVGDGGEPIMHYVGDDEEDEACWIADTIEFNRKQTSFKCADHAILLRTNALMRRYEEELRKKKIPYKVSGSISFFERKEIKDVVSYLRFFSNPLDELSLMRVLKVPSKGITPTALELLDEFAAGRKMSMWDALLRHGDLEKLSAEQHSIIDSFLGFFREYDEKFRSGALAATFREVLDACGYMAALKRASRDDAEYADRLANVEEMLHGLETYEVRNKKSKPTLDKFLHELALVNSEDDKEEDEASRRGATLMTLHKSKGLEFPVVFLASLDRDIVPSPRAVEEGNIEEERRLFYVGMTRAKKKLYLTYPASKVFRGKTRQVVPCPFLYEIPEEFLDGKIGEKEQAEKSEFIDNFFKEMKLKFATKEDEQKGTGAAV
jgi:DNA helicase II / ATP-dependent DNA helicase PcrA